MIYYISHIVVFTILTVTWKTLYATQQILGDIYNFGMMFIIAAFWIVFTIERKIK